MAVKVMRMLREWLGLGWESSHAPRWMGLQGRLHHPTLHLMDHLWLAVGSVMLHLHSGWSCLGGG
jgi:hypothetical protein